MHSQYVKSIARKVVSLLSRSSVHLKDCTIPIRTSTERETDMANDALVVAYG